MALPRGPNTCCASTQLILPVPMTSERESSTTTDMEVAGRQG